MSRLRRMLVSAIASALVLAPGTFPVAQAAPSTTIVLTIDQREATVNGDAVTLDTAPVLDQAAGRTFVPVRFIGETLGAYIGWDGDAEKVTYLAGNTAINLWIGKKVAEVNGSEVSLDAPPYVDANGRTLVPVRFVSEQMGAAVTWDGDREAVTIAAPWVGRLVTIQHRQFSPATLEVSVGTRVTWVNLDNMAHNVVGAELASPDLTLGQAYSFTFAEAGSFGYDCIYHDGMSGTVVVR